MARSSRIVARVGRPLVAVLALAALAFAVAVVPASSAPAKKVKIHHCKLVNVTPQHLAALATVLRTGGMTCAQARNVVRNNRPKHGTGRFRVGGTFRLGKFHCRVFRHIEEDTRARCTHERKGFRVDYGS